MCLELQKVVGPRLENNCDTMSENNFQIMSARVTFKNVPIHKLANFSFKDVSAACKSFMEISSVSECVIIQTASRIEVFTVGNVQRGEIPDARRVEGKNLDINKILKTWASLVELNQFDLDHWDQTLEIYKNVDVYENLLRLASGLESFVVGKEEIIEELQESILIARQAKTSGKILDKLFDSCIRIATNIRESTGIGKDIVTVGDKAVKLTEEYVGDIGKKHVLLIGTGETAGLVAKALGKKDYPFDVTSMTIERATGFSEKMGGKPIEFEGVLPGFDKFDIIFVATTADAFLITFDKINRVMEKKKKGTLIFDLSEPRTVDEKISSIKGIKFVNPSQISEMIDESTKVRKDAVSAATKMIGKEIPILEATMKQFGGGSVIKA
jgi:glutamyl-tRNA reductase